MIADSQRERVKEFLVSVQADKDGKDVSNTDDRTRKNVLDLNLLVFVDVSGSINQKQFASFMGKLDQIRGLSRIRVVQTDTTVQAVYNYFSENRNPVVTLRGGGGTDFTEAFKFAKKAKPDAILFMTDGFAGGNVKDPGIPTGWILTKDGRIPYEFGLEIDRLTSDEE